MKTIIVYDGTFRRYRPKVTLSQVPDNITGEEVRSLLFRAGIDATYWTPAVWEDCPDLVCYHWRSSGPGRRLSYRELVAQAQASPFSD